MRRLWAFVYRIICLLLLLTAGSLYSQPVDFGNSIAPLIFRHCTPCHQPGGAGPMAFTSYRDVVAYGAMIGYVTKTRYMPPWRATSDYGAFAHDRSLSEAQIELIQNWAKDGFREGPKLASDNWRHYQLTPPDPEKWDLELKMDTAFEQYDIYFDQYQVFRLRPELKEGRWVKAVQLVPGDPSIVRYVSVSLNTQPVARRLDAWDPRYGYTSFGGPGFVPDTDAWFTWAVGTPPVSENVLRYLPAGAELLVYIHYGPTATRKLDRSAIRLKFADAPAEQPKTISVSLINPMVSATGKLEIPAGQTQSLHATTTLPTILELRALEPRALLLATSWEVYAITPDGRVIRLLKIPEYDVHWRREYVLEKPVVLPAGTKLHAVAHYDNRASNPAIPVNPPLTAGWGYRIFDEQFAVYFRLSLPEGKPGYTILPTAGNGLCDKLPVHFVTSKAGRYGVQLQRFGDAQGEEASLTYEVPEAGEHHTTVSLTDKVAGNYLVRLIDEQGETLATNVFVYWPVELTKSILDE